MWEKPVYKMKAKSGNFVYIDVTTSCAPALKPNKSIYDAAAFFQRKGVKSVLDFGAGALRQSFPLLQRGIPVCAVEFKEQFNSPACKRALRRARRNPNFSKLIFPSQFIKDRRKFDAALLCFVIPTMPRPRERKKLLKLLKKKLRDKSYIFWMSQYGKYEEYMRPECEVGDGWYLQPKRTYHSFYREYRNSDIDDMLAKIGYNLIRFLGSSGHDQFRLYARGGGSWP